MLYVKIEYLIRSENKRAKTNQATQAESSGKLLEIRIIYPLSLIMHCVLSLVF